MEPSYGFLAVLPSLIAILLALRTKQVYVSLIIGIFSGWMIIQKGNPLSAFYATLQGFVDVFKSPGNTRTVMFCALVGALLLLIQKSGGVEGFMRLVNQLLDSVERKKEGRSRTVVQLMAWGTGILLFIESSINIFTVGTLYRPVMDKLGVSREKFSYIVDSGSVPSCLLVPFNAWGAFIMGLLAVQGFTDPFSAMFRAWPYNFYPMLALLSVLFIILTKKDFGPMAKAEERTRKTGKLMNDGAKPLLSADITMVEIKEGVKPKALNMLLPLGTMILMMPVMLVVTGWEKVIPGLSFGQSVYQAIGQGSGSSSVLTSVAIAILVSFILYRSQKIFRTGEMFDLVMKGISGLIPLALLMMLAFSISDVCMKLQTGIYVANLSKSFLSPQLVPMVVFLIAATIAFSTGTSWGTFAIMMSIAIPMAKMTGANVDLVIAAVLGGGLFGDHCSPISDTVIMSSMASACDHLDHVKTQLPYAFVMGGITAILYLILGFIL
jgi:tetracycline resistance efflux pump